MRVFDLVFLLSVSGFLATRSPFSGVVVLVLGLLIRIQLFRMRLLLGGGLRECSGRQACPRADPGSRLVCHPSALGAGIRGSEPGRNRIQPLLARGDSDFFALCCDDGGSCRRKEEAMISAVFLALLVFSLYTLFTSSDVLEFSGAMLRVALALLGVVASRETSIPMLPGAVMLFAVIAIALLAISRGEVQLENDEP